MWIPLGIVEVGETDQREHGESIMTKIKTKLIKPKPLRDFNRNPMRMLMEGHTLIIYNNVVEHINCPKCAKR